MRNETVVLLIPGASIQLKGKNGRPAFLDLSFREFKALCEIELLLASKSVFYLTFDCWVWSPKLFTSLLKILNGGSQCNRYRAVNI